MGASFFYKLRHITRLYRVVNKQCAKEFKRAKLDTRDNLEMTTTVLHNDIYNVEKPVEVNQLRNKLEGIETRKAKGTAIRSRVKWHKVRDKCIVEFFKSV